MVLTPDLDSILKDVPQQMPEDLPEEPRVTRVDRKDRPARKRCYDSEVFRGEGFPRKDFYIYFSRVSLVPYRVVAVVSLYHKNWLKLHRRP